MPTIENQYLTVDLAAKGAELQRIFHKGHQLEYLWNGDPAFWAKKSPILFPIVGTLKDETYFYKDKPYHLGRHGFARELEFAIEEQQPDSIRFLLHSDAGTLEKFPFAFELRISYRLTGEKLVTGYFVKNPSGATGEDLYFSIGGHPAFRLPLVSGTAYTDYYLLFDHEETTPRWPITKEGLIGHSPEPFMKDQARVPLQKDLFIRDALVFKQPASSSVSLRSDKTAHGLDFGFKGFPFLGIWAAPGADFVCIEPWCGIADSVDTDQQLTTKEGINRLGAGEHFEKSWSVTLF